ncbi:MAG: SDR family oxidoreductase [Chloroflexota bacterium]|nr:SDR family oxidoreductase [Chloroflexota bacterium]
MQIRDWLVPIVNPRMSHARYHFSTHQVKVAPFLAAALAPDALGALAALVGPIRMKDFQLALITGGSSGIGLALAKALYQEGTSLCLLARDMTKLKKAQKGISTLAINEYQKVDIISCDATDYQDLFQKLAKWTALAGLPDLVINAAGVTYPGYFQDLGLDIFHRQMDVNYFGTLNVIKCLIDDMIQRGSGTIVNISSQAGFVGVFGYSAYSPSKYAVRGLTDVLRSEMKPLGIDFHIVFPPDTETPQLAFEKDLKPPETKAIAGAASVLSAEKVAESILAGVKKGQYVIIPGFEGKLIYRMIGLMGNLIYPLVDWIIRKAQKNK